MATERDSGRSSQRTEETPDQFIIHLKNYLALWLELPGRSSGNFNDLVDLIVMKAQFINACSEELAVYLLERGPKELVEVTTCASQYLIAHKQQLGGKTKSTVQLKFAEQGNQHSLNYVRHKDDRGRYSATYAKVMVTNSRNVRPK